MTLCDQYCSDNRACNMKTLLLLVVGAVLLQLVTSSPVGPFADVTGLRGRLVRSQHTKTQATSVKGHPTPPPPALELRKGEYECEGRVCRLQPGQVPEGCNGICQYRL